jgi:N-acetyl-gamma-glutamyl-phosphate reductase
MNIRIGIFGATGYTGQELLRILSNHPDVVLIAAASQTQAGTKVAQFLSCPRSSLSNLPLSFVSFEEALATPMDAAFLCLSHGEGMQIAARLLEMRVRVIDLSADFRLQSTEQYEKVYGVRHQAPNCLQDFVYGLPELFRDKLRAARAVANPGCYPTTVALALAPFAQLQLLSDAGAIIVDSKSGVTGAGRKPTDTTHFVSVHDNFKPYNVCRSHRHVPEMEQLLYQYLPSAQNKIIFTPSLLPVARGMLSSVYVPLKSQMTTEQCRDVLLRHYADEPFVTVLSDESSTPCTAYVRGTNHAVLSVHAFESTALVLVAIDNLGKGASGQAVQNFNLMFGIEECRGLDKTASRY